MATMASMYWRGRRWPYVIVLHGRSAPSGPEWDAYCDSLGSTSEPALRGIIVTLRGGPNARQRAQHARIHGGLGLHDGVGCLVSDSAMARGILAAITWAGLIQRTHAFPLRELEDGLAYVGVERDEMPGLIEELTRLGDTIDDGNPVRMALDRMRRAS